MPAPVSNSLGGGALLVAQLVPKTRPSSRMRVRLLHHPPTPWGKGYTPYVLAGGEATWESMPVSSK